METPRDTLQYRDEYKRWFQTEATSYMVGSNGELKIWKDLGNGLTQFIECIPRGHWTSVRSTAKDSQATRQIT